MNIRKEIIRSIIDLGRHKAFYGHIIQQFDKVFLGDNSKITTAGVGRLKGERLIKLFVCEPYFESLYKKDPKYIRSAMEHEILHIAFEHLFLEFANKDIGGLAVDCVINSCINESDVLDSWVHPGFFKPPLPLNKSSVWYYKELQKPEYKEQVGKYGGGGKGSAGQGEGRGDHSLWENVKEDGLTQEFVKDVIRKAADLCRDNNSYGDIPGNVITQVEKLLKRKKATLPWNQILRMFAASATESCLDYTVKRISKRYGTRPGTRTGDVLSLAVIIDTSMSIRDRELALFWNEIRWIYKNGANITIYECDTRVHGPTKYRGRWDGKTHGRGGTSFEPALKAVEGKYDAAIYFTDFEAAKVSRKYRIPLLWVLTHPPYEDVYPWAKKIVIPKMEELT